MSVEGFELFHIFSDLLIFIALFFIVTGVVGLLRFPGILNKMHAASVSDSFGVPLLLLGGMIYSGASFTTLKIGLVIIVIYIVNPMITMELGNFYINKKAEGEDENG